MPGRTGHFCVGTEGYYCSGLNLWTPACDCKDVPFGTPG